MCWKKEYKCYRGKNDEECCNSRVQEAVAHRTYLIMLVISVGLMIVALTVKTANNVAFVEQVSFASTITSIVLSVIAIWMSISGERQTNEIKEKVIMSSDKLAKSVNDSQNIVSDLQVTLDNQNQAYREINIKIEELLESVHGVDESVKMVHMLFDDKSQKSVSKNDSRGGIDYIKNLLNGLKQWQYRELLIECMVSAFENDRGKSIPDIVREKCNEQDLSDSTQDLIAGMMCVFYHNNAFLDEQTISEFKLYINKEI